MKRQRRHLPVLFLLLLFASGTVLGQEWTWTGPTNVSNTQYGSFSPDIAVSPEGEIHVVWEDGTRFWEKYRSLTANDILYVHYDGVSWSSPVQISPMDTTTTFSKKPRIALDSKGSPHVVWTHNGYVPTGEAYYSTLTDTGWTEPFNFTGDSYPTWIPDIAIDSEDRVHITWDGLNDSFIYDICYRSVKDGVWSDTMHITHMTDRDVSASRVAIDSQDRLHVVWWRAYYDFAIVHSMFDGTSWSSEVEVSTPGVVLARDPVVAVDSQDNPHVVWRQRDYINPPDTDVINRVYYSHFDGDSWIEPEDILPEGADLSLPYLAIAVSTDDIPIIGVAYFEDDEWMTASLMYRLSSGWTFPWSYISGALTPGQSFVVDETNSIHSAITYNVSPGGSPEIHYYRGDRVDGVADELAQLPDNPLLLFSYPNPFNSTVSLRFALPIRSSITLIIYNSQGRKVQLLERSVLPPGSHTRSWRGLNDQGEPVSSGVYLVQLKTETKSISQRITLVR